MNRPSYTEQKFLDFLSVIISLAKLAIKYDYTMTSKESIRTFITISEDLLDQAKKNQKKTEKA